VSRAGRAMTDQAAEAAIDSACRLLRLPTVRARVADLAESAGREQLSYRAFLSELLLAECDERDQRRRDRRVREAGFPVDKRLDGFDYTFNPQVNPAVVN
jgi:DNA replication protein DnaC